MIPISLPVVLRVGSEVAFVSMDLVILAEAVCVVRRVNGDGDCLFASVAHQLFGYAIGSDAHVAMTAALREMVVEHLYDNVNNVEFSLAIRLRVEEELPWLLEASDEATVRNFLPVLAGKHIWGGDESLSALAQIFSCVIRVHREGASSIDALGQPGGPGPVLGVVYRGQVNRWDHYDSLCLLDRFSAENQTTGIAVNAAGEPVGSVPVRGGHCSVFPSDRGTGCLFFALAHQLFACSPRSADHVEIARLVRRMVVRHMRSLIDRELGELIDSRLSRDFPGLAAESPVIRRGRFLTMLETSEIGGGQESISVFSQLFRCQVETFLERGPITVTADLAASSSRRVNGKYDHYTTCCSYCVKPNRGSPAGEAPPPPPCQPVRCCQGIGYGRHCASRTGCAGCSHYW